MNEARFFQSDYVKPKTGEEEYGVYVIRVDYEPYEAVYVGVSVDVERRFQEHLSGGGAIATRELMRYCERRDIPLYAEIVGQAFGYSEAMQEETKEIARQLRKRQPLFNSKQDLNRGAVYNEKLRSRFVFRKVPKRVDVPEKFERLTKEEAQFLKEVMR